MISDFEDMGVRAIVRDAARYESDMRRVQSSTDATARTITKATGGLTGLGTSLGSIGSKAASAGQAMSLALTLPIVGVGAAATKLALDFESQMLKIAALTNTPKEEIEGLRQGILDLSHELGVAPVEVAAGAYFALSAGLEDSAEAMEVMRIAGKAAALGLGDQATIVNLVTSVMTAYGKGAKDAGKITDSLIGIIAAGKGEPREFAASIGMLLPLASQMGIEFEEVGAVLATLTNQGLDASQASIYLRGVLTQLISPSDRAKKKFEELGIPLEKFRAEVRKGFVPAMAAVIEATGGSEAALAELFPDVQGLIGILGAFTNQLGQTEDNLVTIGGASGSLDKGWDELSKTSGFQLRQSLNDVNIELTKLGDRVLPLIVDVLKPTVSTVSELADAFGSLPGPVQEGIVLMGGLVAAMGPALFIFGNTAKGVGALVSLLPILAANFGTVAAAALPVTAALAVLAVALASTSEGGRDMLRSIGDKMALQLDKVTGLLGTATPFWDSYIESLKDSAQAAEDSEKAYSGTNDELDRVLDLVDKASRGIDATPLEIEAVKVENLTEALKHLREKYDESVFSVGGFSNGLLASVASADFSTQALALLIQNLRAMGEIAIADRIETELLVPLQKTGKQLEETAAGSETAFADMAEAVDPAVAALASLRESAEKESKGIIDAIKSLLPATDETFVEWSKRLDDMADDYVNFQTNLQSILKALVKAHVESPELIIQALEQAGPGVTATMAEQLAQGGVDAVSGVLGDLGTIAGTNTVAMADAVLKNTPAVKAAAADLAAAAQGELNKVPGSKSITLQFVLDMTALDELDRFLIGVSKRAVRRAPVGQQQGMWRVPGPWNVDQFPARLAGGEMVLPAPFAEEMRRFMSGAHAPVAAPAFLAAAAARPVPGSSSSFSASISVESEDRISAAIRRELRGLMFSSGFRR